jgi:hypothetical protein
MVSAGKPEVAVCETRFGDVGKGSRDWVLIGGPLSAPSSSPLKNLEIEALPGLEDPWLCWCVGSFVTLLVA